MVIQTKPVTARGDGNKEFKDSDIIKVDLFDGVQPLTDLKTAYDASITDNSFVKPTVQYKFDGYPLDETIEGITEKAVTLLNGKAKFSRVQTAYTELIENSVLPTA